MAEAEVGLSLTPLLRAGSARAGCPGLFGFQTSSQLESPEPLWAACSSVRPTSE